MANQELGQVLLAVILSIQHFAVYAQDNRMVFCARRQEGANPCYFECSHGDASTLAPTLMKLSHENSRCRQGLNLRIDRTVNFANGTIRNSWFDAFDVKIVEMEMNLDYITQIESNAFNSFAFWFIDTLTLNNLKLNTFEANIFKSFIRLKTLKLFQLRTTDFPSGWLNGVSEHLEYLLVYGSMSTPYNVNGLTNGAKMKNLRLATYSLNLYDSIDANSFTGLSAVLTLELSTCAIEYIGPGAFDPLAGTLRLLKLNHNKLKYLPAGLFDKLLPSSFLNIYLSSNPFDCTCNIDDFQNQLIRNSFNFVGSPKCNTPYYMNNQDILTADFCVNGTDTNMFTNVFVRCYSDDRQYFYALLQRPQQQFRLVLERKGDLILQQFRTKDQPLALIVHTHTRTMRGPDAYNIPEFNCFWNLRQSFAISAGMELWKLYTFCVMDPKNPTVSAMDCSSYMHHYKNFRRIWLLKIDKQEVALLCALITVLNFIGGIFIGCLSRALWSRRRRPAEPCAINEEPNEYVDTSDLYEESSETPSLPGSRRPTSRYFEELAKIPQTETPFDVTYVYQSKFDIVPPALPSTKADDANQ